MKKIIYNPVLHLGLYVLLLVATPFLLLQNYLQTAIGMSSEAMLNLGGLELPYVVIVFGSVLLLGLIIFRKHLTRFRVVSFLAIFVFLWLGQQAADFYFDHNFYDLQHNWHYFAYSIFAYLAWRVLSGRNLSTHQIILYTYFGALLISTFDEGIQVFISNRIFDISDIGKDAWGSLLGLSFIFFTIQEGQVFKGKWHLQQPTIAAYLRAPLSLLILAILLNYSLLLVSSLLTEIIYWHIIIIVTLTIFLTVFLIIHYLQHKILRWIILSSIALLVVAQTASFMHYYDSGIVHNRYGLIIYRGIPIPFFDIMIYPEGGFRLVDKKHYFNKRDQATINKYAQDILLIGTGHQGRGGRGFPINEDVQFIYNKNTGQAVQIIRLKTPQACDLFNRLTKEGYSVLFIIHNTC